MKSFFLVGILMLGVSWCKASSEEDLKDISKTGLKVEDFYEQAGEELRSKCHKTGGEEMVRKLTKVLDNLKICLGDHLPKNAKELEELHDSSESSSDEQICTEKRSQVQDCFKDFIEIWKECSSDDEKFIPDFVFDALKAVLDYICTDEKAFFQRVTISLPCFETLMDTNNLTDVCDSEFEALEWDDFQKEPKELICKAMVIGESCYGKYIKKACPGSDFNEIFSGVFRAVHTACDKKHKRSVPGRFKLY